MARRSASATRWPSSSSTTTGSWTIPTATRASRRGASDARRLAATWSDAPALRGCAERALDADLLTLRERFEAPPCVDGLPPLAQSEVVRDDARGDVAASARDRAARVRRRPGHVEVLDRRAVAEMIPHGLLAAERAHEDVALDHVDDVARVVVWGPDVPLQDVRGPHVRRVLRPELDHLIGEVVLDLVEGRRVAVRRIRHDHPAVRGRVSLRRLRGVEHADVAGAERDRRGDLLIRDLALLRQDLLDRLDADVVLERRVHVRVERRGLVVRRVPQRQVQTEESPLGVLEALDLRAVIGRQPLEADHLLERLRHVDRARDELARADRAPVLELHAGRAAALD